MSRRRATGTTGAGARGAGALRSTALVIGLFGAAALPVAGAPGNAFLALSPAPETGTFEVDAYLQDPGGWPALAQTHARGWAVAYGSAAPPAGWVRPFVWRGGGPACRDGALNPRFASALHDMLPVRESAILTLLDPPAPQACSPGKPNPHPFERDGWLFVHDGVIDIEAITRQVWRADWGPAWQAFKRDHPRDYDGNDDSTRGNAGEIYGLLFLYEWERGSGDAGDALERAIGHLLALEGAAAFQFNALAQSPDGLWAVRYALADPDLYPVYYGVTSYGEHCVVNALPEQGSWQNLPNFTLAHFPPDGPVEVRALTPGAIDEGGAFPTRPGAAPRIRLSIERTPSLGVLRLIHELPPDALGTLELWTLEGRCVRAVPVEGGRRYAVWELPAGLGSGVYLARLRSAAQEARARVVWVK
jgi:hypothetical protein